MFERLYWENAETYAPYERTDNLFDLTNTHRFTGDIVCPEIDRTVMRRFIEYGNDDRWGKRKPEVETVSCQVEDVLQSMPVDATTLHGTRTIGLDINGRGGCQVTLAVASTGLCSVVRGLPSDSLPILSASSDDIAAILDGSAGAESIVRGWDGIESPVATELSELLVSALQREVVATQA